VKFGINLETVVVLVSIPSCAISIGIKRDSMVHSH
jgi:hypothetical protein